MSSSSDSTFPSFDFLSSPSVSVEREEGNSADFIVEPLYTGYGITIGTAMRRVLMSSLSGVAISAVAIKGLDHEFSSIPGVREDFADLALNLKSVVLKRKGVSTEGYVTIYADKPGPVLSSMICENDDFEVLNGDVVICHLASGATLDMKMKVSTGFGYVSSVAVPKEVHNLEGLVPIDTSYNPVRKVTIAVKPTNIGSFVGYDKLILSVETSGSIDPEEAVVQASKILSLQTRCFVNLSDSQSEVKASVYSLASTDVSDSLNDLLSAKVDRLYLSARSRKCLSNENILYIKDLVSRTESSLLKVPNFGRRSLEEVKKELISKGLKLGMSV